MQEVEMSTPKSAKDTHQATPLEPEKWVDEYGDVLFRYALKRVSNRSIAEDLVQSLTGVSPLAFAPSSPTPLIAPNQSISLC